MDKAYLIKQLELYSNAIISFVVLQGLIFVYNFATDPMFNKSVKCVYGLSWGLVILFLITMIAGALANAALCKRIVLLSDSEYADLIEKIYRGKSYIIIYFGLLPAGIIFFFGVLSKSAC